MITTGLAKSNNTISKTLDVTAGRAHLHECMARLFTAILIASLILPLWHEFIHKITVNHENVWQCQGVLDSCHLIGPKPKCIYVVEAQIWHQFIHTNTQKQGKNCHGIVNAILNAYSNRLYIWFHLTLKPIYP